MDKSKDTKELLDKFDDLCSDYAYEDIDVKMLKKGVIEIIDNWSS